MVLKNYINIIGVKRLIGKRNIIKVYVVVWISKIHNKFLLKKGYYIFSYK